MSSHPVGDTTGGARRPELLAPAGGADAAYAALQYGADAIYAGLPRFSARADAENFSIGVLDEVVGYAHQLAPPRRVYVTLNTLVLQRELDAIVSLLHSLTDARVDAVIVQDMGVLRLIRERFPALRIHASTQMAVHNVEGAQVLRERGCRRATLARELPVAEAAEIVRRSGLEVEMFIHGALCYSYSGLCLFSSHALGRSGNRGRCAYCCREAFRRAPAEGPPDDAWRLPFSMKDLFLGDDLEALRSAGVASLKIEGRMKSPLYVAAVTHYYRRRLDGRLSASEACAAEQDIQTIFSRPWTRLYAKGRPAEPVIDAQNVGHRGAWIGRVEAVRADRAGGVWVRFRTLRDLERHDGLQIDLPTQTRPFGFPADEIRRAGRGGHGWRSVVCAPSGGTVAVRLPAGYPPIPAGAAVYCSSSQAVKRRYDVRRPKPGLHRQRRPIRVAATLNAGKLEVHACWTVDPSIEALVRVAGPFGRARQPQKTPEAFTNAFARLSDTGWIAAQLDVRDAEGVFVPLRVLHDARRRLVEALSAAHSRRTAGAIEEMQREVRDAYAPRAAAPAVSDDAAGRWSLKVRDPSRLLRFADGDLPRGTEVVLGLDAGAGRAATCGGLGLIGSRVRREHVRVGLPLIVREADRRGIRSLARDLAADGWRQWEVANAAGLQFLRDAGCACDDVTVDWTGYVLNAASAAEWIAMGARAFVLSPEDDAENMRNMLRRFGARATAPVFQYTPLFVSETDPCMGRSADPDGTRVVARKSGAACRVLREGSRTVLVDERPFSLADRLAELRAWGACAFRVDLAWAPLSSDECARVWRNVRAGRPIPGAHAGNFAAGLA